MSSPKVYIFNKCGTCKKATKYLDEKEIDYQVVPIREQPPTLAELKFMLDCYDGEIRKLFNISGQDYRNGNYKEKLPGMSSEEAMAELANNGNLIKRPFLVYKSVGKVGFKAEEWEQIPW